MPHEHIVGGKLMTISPSFWSIAVVGVALTGCGSAVTMKDTSPAARPGNPAVYERIDATTGCAGLQREFDTAMANVERYEAGDSRREVPLSYAEAANNRSTAFGC